MATVFLRGKVWFAKLRLWDAAAGAWVWVQRSTHCVDRQAAVMVAGVLEQGAGLAGAGSLDRVKAMGMVNDILRFAGLPLLAGVPMTFAFAREMCRAPGLAYKTAQKYAGALDRFERWAGKDRALDGWTTGEMQAYYDGLRGELSVTTCGHHLTFLRMVWGRAVKLGHVQMNPAAGVVSAPGVKLARVPLSRGEVAAVLRVMRRAGERGWVLLTLLGWHTGHRIVDLLGVGAGSLGVAGDVPVVRLQPEKRRGAGGRLVVLPVPGYLAGMVRRWGGCGPMGRKNGSGNVSNDFVEWLRRAGVDPLRVQHKARVVHLKSFHSLRHSMASRLAAAGVHGEVARLVTDHSSPVVHRGYVHAEIEALAGALRKVRRV